MLYRQLLFHYHNDIELNLIKIRLINFDFGKLLKILRVFADESFAEENWQPLSDDANFVYVISVNMRWRGALGRFHEHARQPEAYKIHGPIIQSK